MRLKKGRAAAGASLAAALILPITIIQNPASAAPTASAQVVLDWNSIAVNAVQAAGANQVEGALYVGLVQAAVYDAVIAIEKGFEPYLIAPGVPPGASSPAAAATAAHDVLASYFPGQKASVDAAYAASLGAIPDGPEEDRGVVVGQQVAIGFVAARTDDGRGAPITFTPTPAPGVWRPTPPALLPALSPWLAEVKPLLLHSPDQFRPGPSPALGSRQYARDYDETRLYGAKTGSLRTPQQTETALFWTELVPQQLNRALRDFVVKQGLDLPHAARALAMGATAMADSLIACWDGKYTYGRWRPVTAIPAADSDGNTRTVADPAWESLLPTPNHPEYPSAHNCVTAALGVTLVKLAGTDRIDLDVTSAVTGTTHHFRRVGDLQREIVNARVWVGFHWRTSDEVAYRLGERVATWGLSRQFRPTR